MVHQPKRGKRERERGWSLRRPNGHKPFGLSVTVAYSTIDVSFIAFTAT